MINRLRNWNGAGLGLALAGLTVWGVLHLLYSSRTEAVSAQKGLTSNPGVVEVLSDNRGPKDVAVLLVNHGPGLVTINAIETTCGCTEVIAWDKLLDEGESGRVSVRVDVPPYGKRETQIVVKSDKGALIVPVVLRGRKLDPPFVSTTGTIHRDASSDESLVLIPFEIDCIERKSPVLWLESFESSDPRVTVSAPVEVDAQAFDEATLRRRYRVEVVCEFDSLEASRIEASLTPVVRSPSKRSLPAFPVTVAREPALRLIPSHIVISKSQWRSWPIRREVRLVSAVANWQPIQATSSEKWISVEFADAGPAVRERILVLSVESPPESTTGFVEAQIRVETDLTRARSIEIPVFVESQLLH